MFIVLMAQSVAYVRKPRQARPPTSVTVSNWCKRRRPPLTAFNEEDMAPVVTMPRRHGEDALPYVLSLHSLQPLQDFLHLSVVKAHGRRRHVGVHLVCRGRPGDHRRHDREGEQPAERQFQQ